MQTSKNAKVRINVPVADIAALQVAFPGETLTAIVRKLIEQQLSESKEIDNNELATPQQ